MDSHSVVLYSGDWASGRVCQHLQYDPVQTVSRKECARRLPLGPESGVGLQLGPRLQGVLDQSRSLV